MEYEKKLVSLYENLSFSGLPLAFIDIKKESNVCKLSVSLYKDKQGWLFIYLKEKCFCLDLSRRQEFIFHDDFFCQNEYFFVIKNVKRSLFGKIGNVSLMNEKVIKINNKFSELLKKDAWLAGDDKNQIVDEIVFQMFSEKCTLFFDQTKSQMQAIFMQNKRAKNLEKKIDKSKFVQIGDNCDASFAGVVYKAESVYAISVGNIEEIENLSLQSENAYQFFPVENKPCLGIFLTSRRASDADVCFV